MEKDVLVEVKGLSKKFSRNLKLSMWYGLKEIMNTMLGIKGNKSELRKEEFWALQDLNFEVRRGECIGLIGHNGSGKSTLLKLLNGLIRPDLGKVTMHGKIGAMIELGAGFNPLLSGRENVYINGQLIGFTKEEVDQKMDAILEFAELGKFIDSPVQNYSSGMKARLGFAIVSQMEPDVLLIDEVLAVGDVGFQGKCMKVIHEMMNKSAVFFVSHSMPIVNRYCSRVILLDGGKIVQDSTDVQVPIDKYLDSFQRNELSNKFNSGQIQVQGFSCNGVDMQNETATVKFFSSAVFQLSLLRVDRKVSRLHVKLNLINKNLLVIASVISDEIIVNNDEISINISAEPFNIQPDGYKISLIIFGDDFSNPLLIYDSLYDLRVEGEKDYGGNIVRFQVKTT